MHKNEFTLRDSKVFHGDRVVSAPSLLVRALVGQGANGAVYRALDQVLKREVALKLWYPSKVARQKDRPLEESRKNASIDHPRIVTVHHFDEQADVPYMTMQLITGTSLKEWLALPKPLHERRRVWDQYCEGLRAIYKSNTVHGDPHWGNVLLRETPGMSVIDVRLTDMGASVLRDSREKFENRECDVLRETCTHLLPEFKPAHLLVGEAFASPALTLRALDAAVVAEGCLSRIGQLAGGEDTHDSTSVAQELGVAAFRTPLFDLDVVSARLPVAAGRRTFLAMLQSFVENPEAGHWEYDTGASGEPDLHALSAAYARFSAGWCARFTPSRMEED